VNYLAELNNCSRHQNSERTSDTEQFCLVPLQGREGLLQRQLPGPRDPARRGGREQHGEHLPPLLLLLHPRGRLHGRHDGHDVTSGPPPSPPRTVSPPRRRTRRRFFLLARRGFRDDRRWPVTGARRRHHQLVFVSATEETVRSWWVIAARPGNLERSGLFRKERGER